MTSRVQETGLSESLGEEFFPPHMVQKIHDEANAKDRFKLRRGLMILAFLAAFPILAWFEGLVTGAALITPLSAGFELAERGLWFTITLVLLFLIPSGWTNNAKAFAKRLLAIFSLSFLGALFAYFFVLHAAHLFEFAGSNAMEERATYPVTDINVNGRRSWTRSYDVEIYPFRSGYGLRIPISKEQFKELRALGAPLCITVIQRQSESGAIEVKTYTKYTWKNPRRLMIDRCMK